MFLPDSLYTIHNCPPVLFPVQHEVPCSHNRSFSQSESNARLSPYARPVAVRVLLMIHTPAWPPGHTAWTTHGVVVDTGCSSATDYPRRLGRINNTTAGLPRIFSPRPARIGVLPHDIDPVQSRRAAACSAPALVSAFRLRCRK
jgi:hypothetical protein